MGGVQTTTALPFLREELFIWVMIFHPGEVLASRGSDALYSRSMQKLCSNLLAMTEALQRLEHEFEWLTVSHAAERWRVYQQCRTRFPPISVSYQTPSKSQDSACSVRSNSLGLAI